MGAVKRIKQVAGFGGRYWASDCGHIFKIIQTSEHRQGYRRVPLCPPQGQSRQGKSQKKTVLVHRVIAETWLPNPDGKPQVNHQNNVKSDNSVANLEWATASENMKHREKFRKVNPWIKRRALYGSRGNKPKTATEDSGKSHS